MPKETIVPTYLKCFIKRISFQFYLYLKVKILFEKNMLNWFICQFYLFRKRLLSFSVNYKLFNYFMSLTFTHVFVIYSVSALLLTGSKRKIDRAQCI